MARRKREVVHKTGYYVWIGGKRYWHRTYKGAIDRVMAPSNFYASSHSQVIEVATGRLVWGRRQ